jgi:hypothetical protein
MEKIKKEMEWARGAIFFGFLPLSVWALADRPRHEMAFFIVLFAIVILLNEIRGTLEVIQFMAAESRTPRTDR